MARLQLGVGAKVTVLVSRLHPKNLISKAYVNHTKADKVEGLVVVSEGPKLIRREEKLVVIFRHPPKDQQTEEFDCWTIHRFAHVAEEGEESGLFNTQQWWWQKWRTIGGLTTKPQHSANYYAHNTNNNTSNRWGTRQRQCSIGDYGHVGVQPIRG